nr:radical SAM family heme chaperone HemW [Thiocapsa imhoffii]
MALYVHLPWCVSKCPYCDFNSHKESSPPFEAYVDRLLQDLDQERMLPAAQRPVTSIYLGGGTPSLFPGASVQRLLDGIRARCRLHSGLEITLEANPGTTDASRLAAYRRAGVNRLSIGAQSLSPRALLALGRIHDQRDIIETVRAARAVGFEQINLDMMFGLPGQDRAGARQDLEALIALAPEHISYYQLTIEPQTRFEACPPRLPDPDTMADMADQGRALLAQAGFRQYEVSAYARPGARCQHNLNYWRFGDYLGLGAGAHGKLTHHDDTTVHSWRVTRRVKRRHPKAYLDAVVCDLSESWELDADDLVLEFALNSLRLTQGFERDLFTRVTNQPWSRIAGPLRLAEQDGLIRIRQGVVQPTDLGRRFLDDLVARFLPVTPSRSGAHLNPPHLIRSDGCGTAAS